MDNPHAQRMLKAIHGTLAVLMNQIHEFSDLYDSERLRSIAPPRACPEVPGFDLRLQRGTYTVHYKNKECFVRSSVGFRILERLAQRPNEYIPTDRLIDELWTGPRAYSTVRSTVCRLKATLRNRGLGDLAERIDGSMPGHYGLMLQDR
jgi:hypothetical protein